MEGRLVKRSDQTVVYRIGGQRYVILQDGDDDGFVYVGDFTGDGHNDLVIETETLIETVRVYGPNEHPRYKFQLDASYDHPLLADIDGDGCEELLNLEGAELAAYHYKADRTVVAGWPYERWAPTAAADLDGDGVDEVISVFSELKVKDLPFAPEKERNLAPPENATEQQLAVWTAEHARPRGGYLNPVTKQLVDFQFPETNYRYNYYLGMPDEVAAFDIDGDGQREIITKAALGSHLLAFNQAGELVYHEEFGKPALSFGVVHGVDREYLVVELDDRLLIYP